MAGNKIFYVTRTEDEATQTAGAATKTRADKPQLLKIVGVDHAGNPDPASPEDNQIYATEEENQEILLTSDTVQDGDYNPVTSDAVFDYIQDQLELSDWETVASNKSGSYSFTADYDGYVSYINNAWTSDGNTGFIRVNGHTCNSWAVPSGFAMGDNVVANTAFVNKGDVVEGLSSGGTYNILARWYKLRDYSRRS